MNLRYFYKKYIIRYQMYYNKKTKLSNIEIYNFFYHTMYYEYYLDKITIYLYDILMKQSFQKKKKYLLFSFEIIDDLLNST